MSQPRLRMFAGPNGSGKSTIKDKLVKIDPKLLGIYINPDDIKQEIDSSGFINLGRFRIKTTEKEIIARLKKSAVLANAGLVDKVNGLRLQKNSLYLGDPNLTEAAISPLGDFLHESLVAAGTSFSFETVMSHPNKIDLLKRSRAAGFRNYLYYVATEDAEINKSRVQTRVKAGGHPVDPKKIVDRYFRSLDLLLDAINATDRTYIFDNSGTEAIFVAEITDGRSVEIKSPNVPVWFKTYVLDKGT